VGYVEGRRVKRNTPVSEKYSCEKSRRRRERGENPAKRD
jgi:hypothetical protein